jgi:hypothetical protein
LQALRFALPLGLIQTVSRWEGILLDLDDRDGNRLHLGGDHDAKRQVGAPDGLCPQ